MRDECMAPNRKQRALMLQMNAVERRIGQKVPAAAQIRKIQGGQGPCHRAGSWEQTGWTGESDEHKKDIAPYSRMPLKTDGLTKNEPKTNPFLIFKTTASSEHRKRSGQFVLVESCARANAASTHKVREGGWLPQGRSPSLEFLHFALGYRVVRL
jgi:hypothetical protein